MQELGQQGFVPVTFPANAWALSTVLGCLQPQPVTLTGQGGVTVIDADGSPETGSGSQLTAADLAPPGKTDFNNPAEGPVVSDLGTAIRYDRPWRGTSQGQPDYDYLDQVTRDSPNGQATPVADRGVRGTASHRHRVSVADNGERRGTRHLRCDRHRCGRQRALLQLELRRWRPGSEAPSPQVTFGNAGQYNVTVQVTDSQGGGGVASIPITVGTPPAPATGGHNQKGAGKNKKSHSPTGPVKEFRYPRRRPRLASRTPASRRRRARAPQPPARAPPRRRQPARRPPPPLRRAPRPMHPRPSHDGVEETTDQRPSLRPTTPPPQSGSTVVGLLVSDVTPLPSGVSPLVHTRPSAAVRRRRPRDRQSGRRCCRRSARVSRYSSCWASGPAASCGVAAGGGRRPSPAEILVVITALP